MGHLRGRLESLEEVSRLEATGELKEAFDQLTDEEIILILAVTVRETARRETASLGEEDRTPAEAEAVAKAEDLLTEKLEAAVGSVERLSAQEERQRIQEVLAQTLFADGRQARLRGLWGDLLNRDDALRESYQATRRGA